MKRTKEITIVDKLIPKMTITKEYPKSKAPSWIRQFYNSDRQNQENHF